jgi:hypothetical protein
MDRNQKIALGCGGAGCLGLLAIVIICVVLVMTGYITMPGSSSNRNKNFNANTNSNSNSNLNENSNSNAPTSSSSLSDDEKHKLVQAAGMTQDSALIQRVLRKLGFVTATNEISDEYQAFLKSHTEWAKNNYPFIRSVMTPEKARAYVEAHIDD